MEIVTAGQLYLDIDAYAGCLAYAELLQTHGRAAVAVSAAPLNGSISRTIRSWAAPLQAVYKPDPHDTFSIIDVSNPEYFDKIVDLERVVAVIDHHVGFERYWQERLGPNARIEFIGAACTLVYECWRDTGQFDAMSRLSARLLVSGILDNTLNFGAQVTDQRDIDAHAALLKRAQLPSDWTAQYFSECQAAILQDVGQALDNDTKMLHFKTFALPVRTAQLAVWDAREVLQQHQPAMEAALAAAPGDWLINLISVGERRSYFVSSGRGVQDWLGGLLGVGFDGVVAAADRLWLRKEIIKRDADTGV